MSSILHEKAPWATGYELLTKKFFLPCGVCSSVGCYWEGDCKRRPPMADPIVDNWTHISPITRR